jgi:hypothetical protein
MTTDHSLVERAEASNFHDMVCSSTCVEETKYSSAYPIYVYVQSGPPKVS